MPKNPLAGSERIWGSRPLSKAKKIRRLVTLAVRGSSASGGWGNAEGNGR